MFAWLSPLGLRQPLRHDPHQLRRRLGPTLDRAFARWCLTVECDRPRRWAASRPRQARGTASRRLAAWGNASNSSGEIGLHCVSCRRLRNPARPRCRRRGSRAKRASTSWARVSHRPGVRPLREPPRLLPPPDPRAR